MVKWKEVALRITKYLYNLSLTCEAPLLSFYPAPNVSFRAKWGISNLICNFYIRSFRADYGCSSLTPGIGLFMVCSFRANWL